MDIGIASVASITVIAYLIGQTCKAVKGFPDSWIPLACGIAGGALGIIGKAIMPDFPASDGLTAVAVGIVSGLSATGINQLYKQNLK